MRLDMTKSFVKKGAEIALRHFRNVESRRKGADRQVVTAADGEIEEFLKKRIMEAFPGEAILGEETGMSGAPEPKPAEKKKPLTAVEQMFGPLPEKTTVKDLFKSTAPVVTAGAGETSGPLWAIDPIDGTAAYACGLPVWAVSLGCIENSRPTLGVIAIPAASEVYSGDSNGVFLNDRRRLHLKDAVDEFESQSVLLVTSNAHLNYDITFPGKARSFGSLAAHICYLASGAVDAVLLGRPHLWDICAGAAMVIHQGGVFLTLSGKPLDWMPLIRGGRPDEPIIAGPEKTVRALLPMIKIKREIDY